MRIPLSLESYGGEGDRVLMLSVNTTQRTVMDQLYAQVFQEVGQVTTGDLGLSRREDVFSLTVSGKAFRQMRRRNR